MAGGYYTALSGLQARMDALDRLAADIANASTAGYKTERSATTQADRPSFGTTLQSAVDVVHGGSRMDLRAGPLAATGRSLDVAIHGKGFFVVQTAQGERYTRNGHLIRGVDGTLATDEGDTVLGVSGPLKVGTGTVEVDSDGTVRSGGSIAGVLRIVDFSDLTKLARDGGSRFLHGRRPDGRGRTLGAVRFNSKQSNVSVVDRIAELTEVTRSYETLLRGVSVIMNDMDRGAITELSRK